MQVSFHIICSDTALGRIQSCLKGILSATVQTEIAPYWKMPGCSEITCGYSAIHVDAAVLQDVVMKISGMDNLIISQQGDCVEYSVYTTIEEITSSDACAFVVCFVNMKENAI